MKQKIIEELKEYGWNYVVDRFTEQGRHHFQKYNIFEFEGTEQKLAELQYVLIFDYECDDECHIQTCRKFGRFEEIEPFVGKVLWGCDKTLDGTALRVDELELFLEYMKILNDERGVHYES